MQTKANIVGQLIGFGLAYVVVYFTVAYHGSPVMREHAAAWALFTLLGAYASCYGFRYLFGRLSRSDRSPPRP
jgi:hypothetical protein